MLVVRPVGLVGRALLFGYILHALQNQITRLRMQGQVNAQSLGCALAGVVIGRGSNATKRKHHIAGNKGAAQGFGDTGWVITHIVGIGDC